MLIKLSVHRIELRIIIFCQKVYHHSVKKFPSPDEIGARLYYQTKKKTTMRTRKESTEPTNPVSIRVALHRQAASKAVCESPPSLDRGRAAIPSCRALFQPLRSTSAVGRLTCSPLPLLHPWLRTEPAGRFLCRGLQLRRRSHDPKTDSTRSGFIPRSAGDPQQWRAAACLNWNGRAACSRL